MSITQDKKQEIIKEYKVTQNDTGSAEVQCAILTTRIKNLTTHFKKHKKDLHSRRGLIIMVERRRKILKYLKNKDESTYKKIIKKLELRK